MHRPALQACELRLDSLTTTKATTARSAFTLIELLIVIAIIAILASLTLVVAGQVTQGGKKSLTENTIRVLDQMAASVSADSGSKLASTYTDDAGVAFPMIDGRPAGLSGSQTSDPALPSLSLLLSELAKRSPIDSQLAAINPKLVTRGNGSNFSSFALNGLATPTDVQRKDSSGMPKPVTDQLIVKDAWGNPLRFVHPKYQGGYGDYVLADNTTKPRAKLKLSNMGIEISRSYRPYSSGTGDSDEGLCAGNTPYFYSAGPDADAGTRGDNVYSGKPAFPPETAKFNLN